MVWWYIYIVFSQPKSTHFYSVSELCIRLPFFCLNKSRQQTARLSFLSLFTIKTGNFSIYLMMFILLPPALVKMQLFPWLITSQYHCMVILFPNNYLYHLCTALQATPFRSEFHEFWKVLVYPFSHRNKPDKCLSCSLKIVRQTLSLLLMTMFSHFSMALISMLLLTTTAFCEMRSGKSV